MRRVCGSVVSADDPLSPRLAAVFISCHATRPIATDVHASATVARCRPSLRPSISVAPSTFHVVTGWLSSLRLCYKT